MHGWEVPAAVLAIIAALHSTPKTLGETAQLEALRRALSGPAHTELTNQAIRPFERAAPALPPPPAADDATIGRAAGDTSADKSGDKPADAGEKAVENEAWWRARIDTARKALSRDVMLADALQSRINALTTDWVNRDDPAQKMQIGAERVRTIEELDKMKKQIDADQQAIVDIQDDARKKGVPAGWVREG